MDTAAAQAALVLLAGPVAVAQKMVETVLVALRQLEKVTLVDAGSIPAVAVGAVVPLRLVKTLRELAGTVEMELSLLSLV